ncbi:DNA repair protein RadA [Candidatus Daviesbacteria bacterium RIFCSPHIGHO2_01_FULL_40_11]|uniref:DNA repair protein RadA n=1 Tax=Candidatus Daviesbacteria bacterium RIFCSPHIGHO2_01_FULL_40_11 TaxID=1797762 RepID=A0A1F5JHG3_9BACT|nr:MAG: DNA repair protein RadA [Candidatus Daviesbacteria bacterium RIFCSPHIGHO2_01_FULL_40_11]OGE62926.1 MAG: DNA repair protein RadA [Candidatus Daviesbacteria bacterium RIFCSPLOWO2_01_FULL_40_27]
MVKSSTTYICQQCGYKAPQYLGKCPQCDSWNSFVETIEKSQGVKESKSQRLEKAEIINLSNIKKTEFNRLSTGLGEFDRVMGGGVVLGSLVLVSGDPGIGKSTLLTQLALNVNHESRSMNTGKKENHDSLFKIHNSNVLYVAGEESAQQIKIRVDRINTKADLAVLNETDVDAIIEAISQARPSLAIVDSIQTLETGDLNSVAGSVGQVRESAHRLQRLAKDLHIPIFLVGHVNKDGMIAGPKTLEHMVDVVLSLEGDSTSNFRILRGSKNRFGPTDEVGVFEMEEKGMIEVKNPSKIFLEQKVSAPGSAIVATLNGIRPILVEIQALVTKSFLPMPRRVGSGIDNNRLQLLTAVLMKRMGLSLFDKDIFVNATGGLKVFEPAADLGICLAIISSIQDKIITPKTVFMGEVGLLGEVRQVRGMEKRIAEAKKLGFSKIISPENAKNLAQAVRLALVL